MQNKELLDSANRRSEELKQISIENTKNLIEKADGLCNGLMTKEEFVEELFSCYSDAFQAGFQSGITFTLKDLQEQGIPIKGEGFE